MFKIERNVKREDLKPDMSKLRRNQLRLKRKQESKQNEKKFLC